MSASGAQIPFSEPIYSPPIEGTFPTSNPVVLITGALTAIGNATALAFAKDDAKVVASAVVKSWARH